MSESTKRAARTLYQGIVAALVIVPVLAGVLADTGIEKLTGIAAVLVGAVAVVSKAVNSLEDAGLIPAWLKGDGQSAGGVSRSDGGYVDARIPVVVASVMLVVAALVLSVAFMARTGPGEQGQADGRPDSRSWASVTT